MFLEKQEDSGEPFADTAKPAQTVALDGMEDFFGDEDDVNRGLSVKEAVHFYNVSAETIRLRAKNGEIPAVRIGGKNGKQGKKWRIYPDGLPETLNSLEKQTKQKPPVDDDFITPESVVEDEPSPANGRFWRGVMQHELLVDELRLQVRDLEGKLQAAAYRNGYLEARLEDSEQKLKLLTVQRDSWWSRMLQGAGRIFGAPC